MCFNIFKKNDNEIVKPLPSLSPTPSLTPTSEPNIWLDLRPINLTKIRLYPYPENKIFKEEFQKIQIVGHHTISGEGIEGDISTWKNGKHNVGTAIIIERSGLPWQLFSSKYWAYHLGSGNHNLDRHSIGVEIDSWGGLILGDGTIKQFGKNQDGTPKMINTIIGKYYAYYGNVVNLPISQIQSYPEGYRGYYYFEKYTNEQIKTFGELLLYWRSKYNIPLYYNPSMFGYSQEALGGKPGLWSHTSYRKDKSDIHPQPEIIEMLKTISTDDMPISFKLKRRWFNFDRKKGYDVA